MKILLIMPPYLGLQQDDGYRWPLMGILYLAANLERNGHEVTIEDFFFLEKGIPHSRYFYYGKKRDYIENILAGNGYDLIGIACPFTSRWPFVRDLLKICKSIRPDVPTIVGGIYPTTFAEKCLQECPSLDYVLKGEADHTIIDFCNALEGRKPFEEVEGLAYRDNSNIRVIPKTHYIDNLDDLPFPAYHLLPMERYFKVMRSLDLRGRLLPLLTSRSCPNQCSFCNMKVTHGIKWRPRSPENVVDEIAFLQKKYNVSYFSIIDDNISLSKRRMEEICRLIIERGLNIKWNCPNGVSIKTLDREVLSLMKQAGCTCLVLPIESANERIRNEVMGKRLSEEAIDRVVYACKDLGILMTGSFIIGYPGDNEETFRETLKMVRKYPFDFVGINILWPYAGTEVYKTCIEKGYLKISDQEGLFSIDTATPIVETEEFTKERVLQWKARIMCEFQKKQGVLLPLFRRLTSKQYRVKTGLDEGLFISLMKLFKQTKNSGAVSDTEPLSRYPEGCDLSVAEGRGTVMYSTSCEDERQAIGG